MNQIKTLKGLVKYMTSRQTFQPLWESLYMLSTAGMNIGGGYNLASSGELWVIDFLTKKMSNREEVIVFDVGAHNGTYARNVVDRIGSKLKLFCFEPSKPLFEDLKKKLGNVDNIQLLNFGFGNKEEFVTMYSNGEGSPLSSIYNRDLSHINILMNHTEEIRLRTLDDFCNDEGIEYINFLKIDVEGNELKVLNGSNNLIKNNSIHFIQFEFGEANIDSRTYFKDIFNLLIPNYKIYRVLNNGLFSIEKYKYIYEIFRVTNYLAISRKIGGVTLTGD